MSTKSKHVPMKDDPAHNWKAYNGGLRKLGFVAAPSGDPTVFPKKAVLLSK